MSDQDSGSSRDEETKPEISERTEPFVMALDAAPSEDVAEAAKEDPLLQDDLSEGAIPITERLRDRRTQASIIVPVLVLVLFAFALPRFQLDTLIDYVLNADRKSVV